jgi:hypothetical protein
MPTPAETSLEAPSLALVDLPDEASVNGMPSSQPLARQCSQLLLPPRRRCQLPARGSQRKHSGFCVWLSLPSLPPKTAHPCHDPRSWS